MAKKIKLHDKTGEQLIPVTRSTTVEMNDGVTLQTAYEGINSSHYTKAEINAAGYLTYHQDLSSYVKWDNKGSMASNTYTLSANRILLSSSSDRYIWGNGGIIFNDNGLRLEPNGNDLLISDNNDDTTQYHFKYDKRGDVAITKDITNAINTYVISASYISSSSLNTTLSSYATSANYDSSTKKIYLKHGTTTLSEIDATDFIKDGMVDTAYVQGANLVISFNTDAGKEAINVPIANIFNANNYYTKSEIDNAGYLTSHQDLSSYVKWNENYAEMLNINVIDDIDRLMFNSSGGQYLTTKNNKLGIGNSGDTDVISFPNFTGSNRTIACVDQLPDMSSYVSKTELNNASYITQTSLSNNSYITATQLNNASYLTEHQSIKTINNNTLVGTGNVTINELPTVSSTDNGKVLQVVNGAWTLVSPVTMYSGTGAPDNSQGNNGDLYMQI